jgi:hypothetical protein
MPYAGIRCYSDHIFLKCSLRSTHPYGKLSYWNGKAASYTKKAPWFRILRLRAMLFNESNTIADLLEAPRLEIFAIFLMRKMARYIEAGALVT